jgi:iron complex outermembrane receptor protein
VGEVHRYDGQLAGLGLGGGVRYVGRSWATKIRSCSAATLFDAAVSYDLAYARPDLKGWKAQINATNLTNEYYVASCLTGLAIAVWAMHARFSEP